MKTKLIRQTCLCVALGLALLTVSAGFLAFGQSVPEDNLPQPKLVIMDKSFPADQVEKSLHAARLFYAFWNTGNPEFAKLALATNFTDRTLANNSTQPKLLIPSCRPVPSILSSLMLHVSAE